MAKVQTRKAVSISAEAHHALVELSVYRNESMSGIVERWIRKERGLPTRKLQRSEHRWSRVRTDDGWVGMEQPRV